MPTRGRQPKDEDKRVNRHPLQHQWTDVVNVPYVPTPTQAKCPVNRAATRRWWAVISTMPHCTLWGEGEWELARMTAVLHARVMENGNGFRELERRERLLGTTDDARRNLRIRYVQEGAEPQPVFTAPGEEEDENTPIVFLDDRRLALGG